MSRGYRVFSDHVVRRYVELRMGLRRLGVRALAALPVFAIGAHLADGTLQELLLAAGRGTAWAGVLAIAASVLARLFEGGRAGSVQIEEGTNAEDDEVELPAGRTRTRLKLRDLREGWAREDRSTGRAKRATVEIVTREGDVWSIQVPNLDAGLVLLAALGLDARQRTMHFERRSDGLAVGAFGVGMVLTAIALGLYAQTIAQLGSSIGLVTIPAVLAAIWATLRRVSAHGPLEIGADGIAWTTSRARHDASFRQHLVARLRGRQRRVVRWRDVERATVRLGVLWLETRTEGIHRIPLGPVPEELAAMIQRRIDDARQRDVEHPSLTAFEPGARSFAEWVAHLRSLDDPKDYRGAAIPKVRVIETLEDPDAPTAHRLGAALALTHADDETTRALGRHLARDAAASVVDPQLAEAFASIAEDRVDETKLMHVATAER
jgi:hypothetical protein